METRWFSAPQPFFPEVNEELTSSWTAPFTAQNCSGSFSTLTSLDARAARRQGMLALEETDGRRSWNLGRLE